METSLNPSKPYAERLIQTGIWFLLAGIFFGLLSALHYVMPGNLTGALSFEKLRPLHVTGTLFWIFGGATGVTTYFWGVYAGQNHHTAWMSEIFRFILVCIFIIAIVGYFMGWFGGREYWEFPTWLAPWMAIGWLFFFIPLLKGFTRLPKEPVYVWMWITGGFFFLYTFAEQYSWLIPGRSYSVVHDMTIQWKSNGSMVGSWNMLIYGSALYLMDRIQANPQGRKSLPFALYFTGLFNLMFNWGHHIYTLPTAPYVRLVSYAVSMTELILLARILWNWRQTMKESYEHMHHAGFRFLAAAEWWILINLMLAIIMSVPVFNLYTHGTHITVAHAMGTTIGINTMLLLGMSYHILKSHSGETRLTRIGFRIIQVSLAIFWISLILAGIQKAYWQMHQPEIPFYQMMKGLRPFFLSFFLSGAALVSGLVMVCIPLLHRDK